MYKIKGKISKREYYQIYIGSFRFLFIVIAVWSFFLGNSEVDKHLLFNFSVWAEYWQVILYNWLIVFLILLAVLVSAAAFTGALRKGDQLDFKEYIFSEEGVTIRNEIGEERISWEKIKRIEEGKSYSVLFLKNLEKIYLFHRFFENKRQKEEVLSFIQSRIGETK